MSPAGSRAVLLAGVLEACVPVVPPVPPGLVSTQGREAGAVDAGAQLGLVIACDEECGSPVGAGALRVEPYVGDRLSIPVEISMYPEGAWMGATRLGLRYRLAHGMALGGGAGPTFVSGDGGTFFGAAFDLDLAAGWQGRGYAASLALRPAYARGPGATRRHGLDHAFFVPVELAGAVDVDEQAAISAHLIAGPWFASEYAWLASDSGFEFTQRADFRSVGAFVAAGVGVVFHFGDTAERNDRDPEWARAIREGSESSSSSR